MRMKLSKSARPITVFIYALLNDAVGQDIGKYWIMNRKRRGRGTHDVIWCDIIIVQFQADIWNQDLSNTKQILPIRTNVRINADLCVCVCVCVRAREKLKYVTKLGYSALSYILYLPII